MLEPHTNVNNDFFQFTIDNYPEAQPNSPRRALSSGDYCFDKVFLFSFSTWLNFLRSRFIIISFLFFKLTKKACFFISFWSQLKFVSLFCKLHPIIFVFNKLLKIEKKNFSEKQNRVETQLKKNVFMIIKLRFI